MKNNGLVSNIYDDIYFSLENGLEEKKHVFLQGNNLTERWKSLNRDFCIIELGFGSGLNFFASRQLWDSQQPPVKLHYIGIEKHPLNIDAIGQATTSWPQMSLYYRQLAEKYPAVPVNGAHSFHFGAVQLDLLFGDANDILPNLHCKADAWFLDGFAPAKNQDMWNDKIYSNISRLTGSSGTFSTYTAAGNVRRGLSQHGFTVQKLPGWGKKRHMLAGFVG